jgi:hypothetical protein
MGKIRNIYEGVKVEALCRDIGIRDERVGLFSYIHILTDYGTQGSEAFDLGIELDSEIIKGIVEGDIDLDIGKLIIPIRFDTFMRSKLGPLKKGGTYDLGEYSFIAKMCVDPEFREEKCDEYMNWVGNRIGGYGPMDILRALWRNPRLAD